MKNILKILASTTAVIVTLMIFSITANADEAHTVQKDESLNKIALEYKATAILASTTAVIVTLMIFSITANVDEAHTVQKREVYNHEKHPKNTFFNDGGNCNTHDIFYNR